ncbi:MAG TPA: beta-phosphoglucomutase [Lachnospiraceae bacterium]|nr:beta-phosphoglucomutase [Lachnospiraceae bacterium]
MKYEAIIFDLDGVICHTDVYHYEAWKAIADKLKIPFDKAINNRLRGVSRRESFEIILEQYNGKLTEEEIEQYISEKNEIYKKLLGNMTPADLAPEVKDTLDTLRAGGLRLAIGSSSKNARFILERLGLSNYFDAISDGTNITHSKPDPEVFLKASEYVGVPTWKCLVVEDAVAGLQAAVSGGMDCAGISDAAKSNLATYQLTHFSDLLKKGVAL